MEVLNKYWISTERTYRRFSSVCKKPLLASRVTIEVKSGWKYIWNVLRLLATLLSVSMVIYLIKWLQSPSYQPNCFTYWPFCFSGCPRPLALSSYTFPNFLLLHAQHDALRCNMSGENEKHMFFQHLVSSTLGFPKNTDLRIRFSNRLDWSIDFSFSWCCY